jgi:hypothetical protein
MFNSIQIFGMALLGGLGAGELARRALSFATNDRLRRFWTAGRTERTGVDRALRHRVQPAFHRSGTGPDPVRAGLPGSALVAVSEGWSRLRAGLLISLSTGSAIVLAILALDFSASSAVFAAALCLATSPAITIATCSDVGARGDKTGLLFTMVAINGCVAFVISTCSMPFLVRTRVNPQPCRRLDGDPGTRRGRGARWFVRRAGANRRSTPGAAARTPAPADSGYHRSRCREPPFTSISRCCCRCCSLAA